MGQTFIEPPPPGLSAAQRSPAALTSGGAARPRWWLWPHLLGLDAPLVALTWQDWWGRSVHEPLAPGQRVVLGFGVWLIYLADRLADSARDRPGDDAAVRHAFARTHRPPLLALSVLIAVVLVVVAPLVLSDGQFRGGLVLLGAVGVYFWLIHRRVSPRWTGRLPKEAAVGGMFALGTAFFVLCRPVPVAASMGMAVVLFGGVCFVNCALITVWERDPRDRRDPVSLLNAFPSLANGGLRTACWWLAVAAVAAGWGWQTVLFTPVALAALALAVLDSWWDRFSAAALRCLVDLVLLTPCVCLGAAVVFRWAALFSLL